MASALIFKTSIGFPKIDGLNLSLSPCNIYMKLGMKIAQNARDPNLKTNNNWVQV